MRRGIGPITKAYRIGCALDNIVSGIKAPFDGMLRGGTYGYKLAPNPGFVINLATGWLMPMLFASVLSSIGFVLGCISTIGCFAEALRQFVAYQPYDYPVSRILVDWIPRSM